MRLSEKTLELSIISQLTARLGQTNAIWFGLTQQQERKLGFDAASTIEGIMLFFQFKASSVLVHPSRFTSQRRRFTIPHDQLDRLQSLAVEFPECVFYVFPDIGTHEELEANQDLVSQSYLLKVASLPSPFPAPTNQSGVHYAYIDPPECELRSQPYIGSLMPLEGFEKQIYSIGATAKRASAWVTRREFNFKGLRIYGLLVPTA